jgi:Tol biopolymer transport system component
MLLVGAMVVVVSHLREKPPLQVRLQVHPPENTTLGRAMAISPDGERIAFSAREDGFGISHLYVRAMNLLTTTRVPGTEGGFEPFWSPDGRQLAFASRGTLKKLDLSGGSPQALCRIGDFVSGASWGRDGVIVFSAGGELFRVAATGGEPQQLGKRTEGETARTSPHFLPDGRYLYFSQTVRPENRGIFVASLASADGKRILPSDGAAVYSPSGHLLFVRGEALMAQAFDVDQLKLSGEPLRVGAQVALYGVSLQATQYGGTAAAAAYTVSRNGVLAWQADSGLGGMQLTWFDRRGKNLGTVGERAAYSNPALSPDERTLAISRVDPGTTTRDVWAYDLVRGTSTRLTFDPADDINPAWSPDGSRVAFTSDRKGVRQIYQKLANGAGDEELLLESTDWWKNVEHWSPDGRFLLYNYYRGGGPADLLLLPLGEGTERKPIPFLATEASEIMGQFAPSGEWIAYVSNESGRPEVYVRAVATDGSSPGGKWQVSTAGGLDPKWRGDQRELFYLSSSTVMAVDVKTEGMRFEAGIPHPLFEVRLPTAPRRNRYVVTRDGQRFLVTAVGDETPSPIDVLVNWLPSKR